MPTSADIVPDDFQIGVIGGGSWGTVLADLLAVKGFAIDLWVYEREVMEQINSHRENRVFLPGIAGKLSLPEPFMVTVGGHPFPVLWSIIGSALFVPVIHLFSRRSY